MNMPTIGVPVICTLEHFFTKNTVQAILVHVEEDDCTWRTADDNSEVAHDWDVIKWEPTND